MRFARNHTTPHDKEPLHEESIPSDRTGQGERHRAARAGRERPRWRASTSKVALIQALIPLGLQAVQDLLEARSPATSPAPAISARGGSPGCVRWGQQRGSIYLADQKLPVTHTRVRDRVRNQEVPLQSYQRSRRRAQADAGLFRKVLLGLSCRDYAAAAEAVPAAFGFSASTVSRRFIQASAEQLQALQERDLGAYDVVALVLDGKTFAQDSMVIALGITLTGEKVVLGFVQTATENERVCAAFLRELVARGLRVGARPPRSSSMAPRASGRRSRASSAPRPPSSAVSGTSGRTSSPTCRRACRIPGGGSSRPPTSGRPTPRRRPRSSGCRRGAPAC